MVLVFKPWLSGHPQTFCISQSGSGSKNVYFEQAPWVCSRCRPGDCALRATKVEALLLIWLGSVFHLFNGLPVMTFRGDVSSMPAEKNKGRVYNQVT